MKKTKFALAALALIAAAGAAQAQSSVSIYGIAEGSISSVNDGTSMLGGGSAKVDQTSVNGLNSRLGFRGTEDLGAGLKAKFEIEQRFGLDTGAAADASKAFFGRSVVGLQGSFGEVLLGRNYSPAYYVALASDPFKHDGTVAALGSTYTFAGYAGNTPSAIRMDNSLTYNLPTFVKGLSVSLAGSAGEGATSSTAGFNAIYTDGPLQVGLGHDYQTADKNLTVAMASYDLGYVKPIVGYSHGEVAGNDTTNFSVGATAPLMGGTVKAVYSIYNPTGMDNSTDKFALGYEYGFSKNTSVFTDLATAKTDGATRTTGVDAGLRHRF